MLMKVRAIERLVELSPAVFRNCKSLTIHPQFWPDHFPVFREPYLKSKYKIRGEFLLSTV